MGGGGEGSAEPISVIPWTSVSREGGAITNSSFNPDTGYITRRIPMKYFALRATMLGVLALCQPAFADEISDLKAEIAAQKAAAEAQKARLDVLEQKLNAVQSQQAAAAPAAPAPAAAAAKPAPAGIAYEGKNFGVRLYGLLDATIGSIDHMGPAGKRKTGFDATPSNAPWFSGARWGISGHRDFADEGFSVIFKLENEYLVKDGSADDPNAAFGRDAWIGVQNDALGKLTFGRQNTLPRDFSQNFGDPYGSASVTLEEGGWTNSNNFKQMIFYAGSASGTRYNNGVVWKKKFEAGLTAGLGYQFGEVTGSPATNSTQAAALAYNVGPFNVSGFVNRANVNGFSHKSYAIGGNYQVGIVRVNAGYFRYTADQGVTLGERTDNAYTLSTKIMPPGKWEYDLGLQQMRANNAALNGAGKVVTAFADGSGATATATGKRTTLYGSVFYHLDQTTEFYFAADHLKLGGGYTQASVTPGQDSQTEFGLGVRFRF
jgi:predicted porin